MFSNQILGDSSPIFYEVMENPHLEIVIPRGFGSIEILIFLFFFEDFHAEPLPIGFKNPHFLRIYTLMQFLVAKCIDIDVKSSAIQIFSEESLF